MVGFEVFFAFQQYYNECLVHSKGSILDIEKHIFYKHFWHGNLVKYYYCEFM